ncbi:Pentapeptide repeats (8 copies) [Arthrobacter ulcerisalmonis]|uniref:Pentapeptide repeats (8 copies) n=1 Tax=Arthrobacter ulcerisalmonis TaxID=2483813 RepID=A0A3P5WSC2_9MICC|nr:pentapeptide repeat-containing protein [Arthrobacter ulcerisalmonis]VDC24588.1 Pentapeptide repeats (8 copies) [Arthrobacter ulcerisalmonis]
MAAAKAKAAKVAPPKAPIRLEDLDLRDLDSAEFQHEDKFDGGRFSRASAEGLDLGGADFSECEFQGISFNDTELRGSRFRDCIISELYAPVFRGARSVWRDVEISNLRLGSAELYESGWQAVHIDGGKVDFLNLRGAKLTDVLITDCIINELDLGSVTGTRVALRNCTLGTLDVHGAKFKDVDLRGSEFRSISGLGSLAGLVIDDYQLSLLAPLLAAHLGLTVL